MTGLQIGVLAIGLLLVLWHCIECVHFVLPLNKKNEAHLKKVKK